MAGRKKVALGFCSPLATKEVILMTAYEILVVVIMIITLAFGIHNNNHK